MTYLIIILIICIISASWFTGKDEFTGATIWIIIMFISSGLITNFLLEVSIASVLSPLLPFTFTFLGIYLVIGLIWSFIKWLQFVRKHYQAIKKAKEYYYSENHSVSDLNSCISTAFSEIFGNERYKTKSYVDILRIRATTKEETFDGSKKSIIENAIPKAGNNKANIIGWMVYWPFSVISFILKDLLEIIYRTLFNLFESVYNTISNKYKSILEKSL